MAENDSAGLVPGRTCGSCNVCCEALTIDTDAIRKAQGVPCVHCTEAGCAIYPNRRLICRE